jgi:hypothetical protein
MYTVFRGKLLDGGQFGDRDDNNITDLEEQISEL